MRVRIDRLLILLFVTLAPTVARASFVVQDWLLETRIHGSSDNSYAFSNQVENPFVAFHPISLGKSSAHTSYDFSWTGSEGLFDFQFSHAAAGVDPTVLSSISSGYIELTTSTDLLFSMSYAYSYYLPRNLTDYDATFSVSTAEGSQLLLNLGCHADTLFETPKAGTCTLDGDLILPAGGAYRVDYMTRINVAGEIGGLATGSGGLHFDLQEIVPEPAALALLLFGAALARKRKRRTF
jgi:hypothetical protein